MPPHGKKPLLITFRIKEINANIYEGFVLFVFLLFCIYVLVARWYFVCEVRGLLRAKTAGGRYPAEDPETDRGRLRHSQEGLDQFRFFDSFCPARLNAADNEAFLDTLAAILDTKSRNMITAFYRDAKTSSPLFLKTRLGARRKLLMKRELNKTGISLDHKYLAPDAPGTAVFQPIRPE